jgi:crossover junction endodeoxyribonuclease RuvC
MNNVLGLDLSMTETGWCVIRNKLDISAVYGTKSFPAPKKGRKNTPDEHPGQQFLQFGQWVSTLIREHQPEAIAYEIPAGQMNAMKALYGLRAILFGAASGMNIQILDIYPSQLKKWATGSGRADKALMRKKLQDRHMYDLDNDNIVDAFWLALWGSSQLKK